MKTLKSVMWVAVIASVCFMSVTENVSATSLTIGDGRELGFVDPGIPAGDPDMAPYVNQLISMPLSTSTIIGGNTFTRSGNSFSPLDAAVLGPRATYANVTAPTVDIDLGAGGYEYLLAKYDGPNYGSEVWYINGLSGTVTIPAFGGQYGISGASLFTPTRTPGVPDGGATMLMLGTALAGLGALKRRIG